MEVHTYLANLGPGQGQPGLARINFLLEYLGHPEKGLNIVHVVGTNGKGSTSQFIASILQAAGQKVGLYTSPHLVRFNERMRINGVPIGDGVLEELFQKLHPCLDKLAVSELGRPGMFEVATAIALEYFNREGMDYAILEAGLGGRYDATHVGQPVVTVFTHIDLDHTEILGETVELIAAEKADVIPWGGVVIMAPQASGAKAVISQVAQARQARTVDVEARYQSAAIKPSPLGTSFTVSSPGQILTLRIGLLGLFQITNALTALAAVDELAEQGLHISGEDIARGLAVARWPGRLEVVDTEPIVVLDGAHNLDGFRQLAKNLPVYLSWEKLHLIMAIVGDKPLDSMLEVLLPLASTVTFTAPQKSRTRPVDPSHLLQLAAGFKPDAEIAASFAEAYSRVQQQAQPQDVVCICGSLYLIGEARHQLVDCRDSAGISPLGAETPKA